MGDSSFFLSSGLRGNRQYFSPGWLMVVVTGRERVIEKEHCVCVHVCQTSSIANRQSARQAGICACVCVRERHQQMCRRLLRVLTVCTPRRAAETH